MSCSFMLSTADCQQAVSFSVPVDKLKPQSMSEVVYGWEDTMLQNPDSLIQMQDSEQAKSYIHCRPLYEFHQAIRPF